MPKPRELSPDSVYSRLHLERWLEEELGVSKDHRKRIWKQTLPRCGGGVHTTSSSKSISRHSNTTKTNEEGILDITSVRDIPRAVIEKFSSKFVLTTTKVLEEKHSIQGSKLVLETQDGHLIETVLIHHYKRDNNNNNNNSANNENDEQDENENRGEEEKKEPELRAGRTTVCVSSQVGCQMGCTFCATGTMGKIANLTASEICEQVHHAKIRYPSTTSWNVVFMGMGEPLDNWSQVKEAIFSLSDPHAFNIPLRRITLSTVGVTHAIYKLAKECPQIQLALSLHAPTNEIRQQIVPTTRGFSLQNILKAIDVYQHNNTRSVMMEYIMIDEINSDTNCAHALVQLLQGRNCMVNLIPYNPTDAGDRYKYKAPTRETIETFQSIVMQNYMGHDNKPIRCTVRWSSAKGQDIDAACGQLALKNIQVNVNNNNNNNNSNTSPTTPKEHDDDIEDLVGAGYRKASSSKKKKSSTKKPALSALKKDNPSPPPTTTTTPPSSSSWLGDGSGRIAMVAVVAAAGGILLTSILWQRQQHQRGGGGGGGFKR